MSINDVMDLVEACNLMAERRAAAGTIEDEEWGD